MRQMIEIGAQERTLEESIDALQKINLKIAKLKAEKTEIEQGIIINIGHDYDGQKSYEVGHMGITIKTTFNYSFDKKMYLSEDFVLPVAFDPVKEETTYKLDKKLVDQYMESAPKKIKNKLIDLITKTPATPSVSIKPLI